MQPVDIILPLSPGGAAEECRALLGVTGSLRIDDLTGWPRFGLKGLGTADWLAEVGIDPPDLNRWAEWRGARVLRLGRNDVTLVAGQADCPALAELRARWAASPGARGYSSWREDAWGWLRLSGAALDMVLARLCAIDLRPGRFPDRGIAQTRFAHMDAVVLRHGPEAQVFFDITATAHVLRRMAHAAEGAAS